MKTLLTVLIMLLLAAENVPAEEKSFAIDPVHSTVVYRVRHLYSKSTGRFNNFSGTITGDPEKPSTFRVEAVVGVGSVDSANKDRDKHLRAADFFNVLKFPEATFKSRRTVLKDDRKADVIGDLTILGKTKEITFTVEFTGYGVDHRKGRRAGFFATTKFNRSDFGM